MIDEPNGVRMYFEVVVTIGKVEENDEASVTWLRRTSWAEGEDTK